MRIVIEIPKECIPTRQDVMDIQLHFVDGKVVEASGYGFAVLSEKHGRLIDADALEEEIRHAWTTGACYRFIENAPTILEADTVEPRESEETETWNGIHAQITAPKGTFDRIFNDADDDEYDI